MTPTQFDLFMRRMIAMRTPKESLLHMLVFYSNQKIKPQNHSKPFPSIPFRSLTRFWGIRYGLLR